MSAPREVGARCTVCDHEVSRELVERGLRCCPKCETSSIPCDPADDVQVRANWHELRILVIYAERWASQRAPADEGEQMRRLVRAIARRLAAQHPERAAKVPLTFLGEVEQLRAAFGKVDQNVVKEDEDLFPPPDPTDSGQA